MLSHVRSAAKHAVFETFGVVQQLPARTCNSVLLTFDDGPHASVTDGVLERLKAFGARAVFFVVGSRIESAPAVLHRIKGQGHVLGNHTFMHSLARQPSSLAYLRDLQKCQRLVADCVGESPRLFRPALGKITPGSLLAPKALRLRTVYWSVDSLDWRLRDGGQAVIEADRLAREISARDIVLFHDDNPYVLDVLDRLLPSLREARYDLQSGADALLNPGTGR